MCGGIRDSEVLAKLRGLLEPKAELERLVGLEEQLAGIERAEGEWRGVLEAGEAEEKAEEKAEGQ